MGIREKVAGHRRGTANQVGMGGCLGKFTPEPKGWAQESGCVRRLMAWCCGGCPGLSTEAVDRAISPCSRCRGGGGRAWTGEA